MLNAYGERPLFMDNKDFSNLGDQIRDSVQDAIDSMDFKQLNRTISDTVNFALDEARSQLESEGRLRHAGRRCSDCRKLYCKRVYGNVSGRRYTL